MAGSVLIHTEDEQLLDDLLRLCAAAGAAADVVHGGPVPAAQWERAPLVLVGDDRAAAGGPGTGSRRPGVLLIGRDLDDHTVWARGVALGAEHVLHLPGDEPWLADRIADAVEDTGPPALTLGLLSGCGGAGGSTLACALALASARQGRPTLLIDGDPLGGGLDVLLGAEETTGLRWPALASSRGRLPATALQEALPEVRGVRLLSWDRSDAARLSAEAMRSVLTAARRRGGAVIIDLPRAADPAAAEALAQLDLGLLVAPPGLRALLASRRVADGAGVAVRDLRAVARRTGAGRNSAEERARLLGLPLAGEVPEEPGLSDAAESGEPPGADPSSPLARFCATLLDRALPVAGAAS
ncbi:septum formation initiator [Streptomyces sodiiphilus]|uniref:Septum formation initiator n=1 Tax=Streptomyces sodiiphilus TaxID=226217 RepID=A0ABP5B1R3_9ACTN